MKADELLALQLNGLADLEIDHLGLWSLIDFETELENPQSRLFLRLAPEDGEGFVLYRRLELGAENEIWIMNLATFSKGMGAGKTLLESFISEIKSRFHLGKILLELSENNSRALSLYRSCGFEFEGVRPKYYRNGANALLMCKYF